MFNRLSFGRKEKIILAVFGALFILTPVTAFVVSEATHVSPTASTGSGSYVPVSSPREVPRDTPLSSLKKQLQASPSPEIKIIDVTPTSTDTATLLLGQTLGFRLILEGRGIDQMSARVFLGLSNGDLVNNPNYLLSFLLQVPQTGIYTGLPLNGLDLGQKYTAYIKGPAQLATAAAFTVKPTPIDLGNLNLITGDVNEDNVIDAADYNIVKSAFGALPNSANWNSNLDFNLDGRINSLDLSIISKNLGKTGLSGPWYSSMQQATKSATISGGPNPAAFIENGPTTGKGYWMWMPTAF